MAELDGLSVTGVFGRRGGAVPAVAEVPPLENGDRLTRCEFERRYAARPDLRKAELIEGVVYMPSPVSLLHAEPHSAIQTLLLVYGAFTPGVHGADNATVRLDLDNEPQPDVLLRIEPEAGGQSRVSEDGYLEGAPELIVEVAAGSASIDVHDKLRAYRRKRRPGVRRLADPRGAHRLVRAGGRRVPPAPARCRRGWSEAGCSRAFASRPTPC